MRNATKVMEFQIENIYNGRMILLIKDRLYKAMSQTKWKIAAKHAKAIKRRATTHLRALCDCTKET